MSLRVRHEHVAAEAFFAGGRLVLRSAEGSAEFDARRVSAAEWVLSRGGRSQVVLVARDRSGTWVHADGRAWLVQPSAGRAGSDASHEGDVVAPMTGKVIEVLAAAGDRVAAGQVLLVLSAMKMRLELRAPRDGVLRGLATTPGAQVEGGDVLAIVEPDGGKAPDAQAGPDGRARP